jgi:Arc/MetJ-type ribon-helix-helix transcriptional regulator
MKDYIAAKLRGGRFSTQSEYIRSLIRDDQDMNGNSEIALLRRRGAVDRHTAPSRPAKAARRRI